MANFPGTSGNDTYTSTDPDNNSLIGGDGNDKLTIERPKDGAVGLFDMAQNTIFGGAGNDKITVRSTNKAPDGTIQFQDSLILTDVGTDKLTIDLVANNGNAEILNNTFGVFPMPLSGDTGKNTFLLKLDGDNSTINDNTILGAADDDKITLDVTSNSGDSYILDNFIVPGGLLEIDKDTIVLKSNAEGSSNISRNILMDAYGGGGSIIFDADAKTGYAEISTNTILRAEMPTDPSENQKIDLFVDTGSKIGGDAIIQMNSVVVGAGDDKLTLKANGGRESKIDDNYIVTGNGVDKVTITGKTTSNHGISISGNSIIAGDGKKTIKLDGTTTKVDERDVNINDNYLLSGADADKIDLILSSSGLADDTQINNNMIIAGDGDNQINLQIKKSSAEDNNVIEDNIISTGFGDDRIDLRVASTGYTPHLMENFILSSGGEDKVKLDVKSTGNVYSDNQVNLTGNIVLLTGDGNDDVDLLASISEKEGNVFLYDNAVQTDQGEDDIHIKVSGSPDYISVCDNSIVTGDGDDRITVTSKSKGQAIVEENSLRGGDDDDRITLTVDAKSDILTLRYNQIEGEAGGDDINIKATFSGSDVTSPLFQGNSILGGEGDDAIDVFFDAKKAANPSVHQNNSIDGGDGDDKIEMTLKSKSASINVYENTITTGDSLEGDEIDLFVESKGNSVYFSDNSIGGGSGSDRIEVDLRGNHIDYKRNSITGGEEADEIILQIDGDSIGDISANGFSGGEGNDYILLEVKGEGIDDLEGNSIFGGTGDDHFVLSLPDGNLNEFLDDGLVNGGVGRDILEFQGKGQTIDLRVLSSADVLGIEEIALDKNSTLRIDQDNVEDMTDGDNELFVTGSKGSNVEVVDLNDDWSNLGTVEINGTDWFHLDANMGGADLYIQSTLSLLDIFPAPVS